MPADHSKHKFLHDIGTDWVALAANGTPLARAATEAGVRRAVPDAAEYITGQGDPNVKSTGEGKAHKAAPRPEPEIERQEEPKQEEPDDKPKQEEPKQEEPKQEEPKQEEPKQEEPDDKPQLDHDGDGKPGGSEKGDNATASRSRRQRRPA